MEKHKGKEIDVIVMPECGLVGYTYKDKSLVEPQAEVCGQGFSFQMCSKLAQEFNAYVVMGYIEKGIEKEEGSLLITRQALQQLLHC